MHETPFGEYLRTLIKSKGYTQIQFLDAVKISKTYLVDVMKSRVKPPNAEMQFKFAEALKLDQKEQIEFFDRAAHERDKVPADVEWLLKNDPTLIALIRGEKNYGK